METNPVISRIQYLSFPWHILPECRCDFFSFVVGKTEQREVIYSEGITASAGIHSDPLENIFCSNESVVSESSLAVPQSFQNLNHRISHDILTSLFFS